MERIITLTIRDFEGTPREVELDMSVIRRISYKESYGDEILKIEYKNGVIAIEDSSDCRELEDGDWKVIYDCKMIELMG